jgi:drug/metabolite transporter (DMT)-like permease
MGAGQIVLSLASKDIFSNEIISIQVILKSKWLWLGIAIYALSMILWIYILSKFDIKYAYPISATAIFFAAIFQSLLQKTMPTGNYWLGLTFVIVGLTILSLDRSN